MQIATESKISLSLPPVAIMLICQLSGLSLLMQRQKVAYLAHHVQRGGEPGECLSKILEAQHCQDWLAQRFLEALLDGSDVRI